MNMRLKHKKDEKVVCFEVSAPWHEAFEFLKHCVGIPNIKCRFTENTDFRYELPIPSEWESNDGKLYEKDSLGAVKATSGLKELSEKGVQAYQKAKELGVPNHQSILFLPIGFIVHFEWETDQSGVEQFLKNNPNKTIQKKIEEEIQMDQKHYVIDEFDIFKNPPPTFFQKIKLIFQIFFGK